VIDPIFFLGLSILLVAISLTAVLIVTVPAVQELGRAARSVEKLADTLTRELPPTLDAIRLTGLEISDLTDDVSSGVKSAGQVVKRVDQSFEGARRQAKQVQISTRSFLTGAKAAWQSFTNSGKANNSKKSRSRRSRDRLPPPRPLAGSTPPTEGFSARSSTASDPDWRLTSSSKPAKQISAKQAVDQLSLSSEPPLQTDQNLEAKPVAQPVRRSDAIASNSPEEGSASSQPTSSDS